VAGKSHLTARSWPPPMRTFKSKRLWLRTWLRSLRRRLMFRLRLRRFLREDAEILRRLGE